MGNDLIERAAEAMLREILRQAEEHACYVDSESDARRCTLDGTFDLVAVARATAAAMREPTPTMAEAGATAMMAHPDDPKAKQEAAAAFRAMIGTALSTKDA